MMTLFIAYIPYHFSLINIIHANDELHLSTYTTQNLWVRMLHNLILLNIYGDYIIQIKFVFFFN